jgi:hypothetical protein
MDKMDLKKTTIKMHFQIRKLKFVIISLFVLVLFFGCNKNENELTYIPGEILFTPENNVPFTTIYDLVDSLDLKIKELKNRNYTFNGTIDSLLALKSELDTKDYLSSDGRTFSFITNDSTADINLTFFDVDDSDFNDWINTQSMYNLTENFNLSILQWSILYVPVGTEQDWVDKIISFDIIESASLNYQK